MTPRTQAPKVDLDATRTQLERVGLNRAAEQLDALIGEAVQDEMSPHRFLDQLLSHELHHREERRVRTSLKLSGLPTGQTLASFDFSFQPSIERSRIETLGTCQWIRENRTLLIQGPPGVGKTHLAIALGVKAIEHGFGVIFYRLEELLSALRRDADLTPARLRRKKYLSTTLLIIDEVGFEPMNCQEASLFFRLVSHRYQRGRGDRPQCDINDWAAASSSRRTRASRIGRRSWQATRCWQQPSSIDSCTTATSWT